MGTSTDQRVDAPARNRDLTATLMLAASLVTVLWLVVVLLWEPSVRALPFDDAFYYLEIGRHLADGAGSTFDGINDTNGYHPLWMAIVAGLFVVGLDGDEATRTALAIQVVLGWGVCLVVLASIAGRLLARWPSGAGATAAARPARWTLFGFVVVAGGSPYVVKSVVNGMESAVAVALQALVLLVAVAWRGRWLDDGTAPASRFGVGLLLALVFLARTDAALLIGCLGIWLVVEVLRADDRAVAVGRAVALLAPATVVAGGYLLWNHATFGTWMQISGLIKRAELDPLRVVSFLVVVGLAALVLRRAAAATLPGAGRTRASRRGGRFPTAARFVDRTGFYAAFCILIIGYYNLLQTQQWLWYYAPVVFYALVLCTLGVADIVQAALRDAPAGMSAQRAMLPVQLIVAVPVVLGAAYGLASFGDPSMRSIIEANETAGAWIAAELPDDAVVASWDAGMLGYASGGRVLNLDGVVNSYDFYEANLAGYPAVADFLACAGVTHVANHGPDLDGGDPGTRAFIARLWGDDVADATTVVHREPFFYSGRTVGSSGESAGGDLAVWVFELPGDPADRCPSA